MTFIIKRKPSGPVIVRIIWTYAGRFLVNGSEAMAFVVLLKVTAFWFPPRQSGLIKVIFGKAEYDKPKVYEAGPYPVACCGELHSSMALFSGIVGAVSANLKGLGRPYLIRR